MGPEREHFTSRRGFLTSIAGALSVGLSRGGDRHFSGIVPDSSGISYRKTKFTGVRQGSMTEKVGYLALPGVSFSSLIINLPYIADADGRIPVLVIDTHDYARFRGWMLREARGTQKTQFMGMIYDDLQRRNLLRCVNYAKYYTKDIQEHLRDYRDAFTSLPDHVNRDAADASAEGYLELGLGTYQETYRSKFNDVDQYTSYRQQVEKYQRKMERGVGDPIGWNDRLLAQYQTALEVRQRVENDLEFPVPYIVGQGESSLIHSALDKDIGHDFVTDLKSEKKVNPRHRILDVDTEKTAETREIIEEINTTARDISGVESNDWFMFGPRLAIPRFPDIYNRALGEMGVNEDLWGYVRETKSVLHHIEKEAADGRSPERILAEGERIAEEIESSDHDAQQIVDQLSSAYDLSNHTRDIKALFETQRYSPTALLLAATIKMDPMHRYNKNEVYRRAVNLQNRVEPVMVDDAQIGRFRDRGDFRVGEPGTDWYHTTDQWR